MSQDRTKIHAPADTDLNLSSYSIRYMVVVVPPVIQEAIHHFRRTLNGEEENNNGNG